LSTINTINQTAPRRFRSEAFFLQLLSKAVAANARDVHLKVGQPPGARVRGEIVYFRLDKLTALDTQDVATHLIRDPEMRANLEALREFDTSFEAEGIGRFRVNIYRQRGTLAVVLRYIPLNVPSLAQLGLPPVVAELAEKERGLVLCVGAAGNGKSSTLAGMIHHLNQTQARHIITIEDPVEFLHQDNKCHISQREIGMDTKSFAAALRAALRQDPDVVHVGEIRDSETMEIALKAAETGHLVLSTLHTPDVMRTMNRMLSLVEGDADELRERLADSLQGIIAQRLLPRADGNGMALAAEILVASGSVREALKRPVGNPPLKELMENGEHPYGMQTFEKHIRKMVKEGLLTRETARQAMGF
jgi:twitching motility protein PilT